MCKTAKGSSKACLKKNFMLMRGKVIGISETNKGILIQPFLKILIFAQTYLRICNATVA